MHLIFNASGKLVDDQTQEIFKGVVPRDLNVGDLFEARVSGSVITNQITAKYNDENDMTIIECVRVVVQ